MKELFSGLVGLTCLLLVFVGLAIPVAVLATYWSHLGPISENPQDWSAFGSVMAGSFTFLAAIATTATLLILIKQKRDSDRVVADQLNALRFEQYVKHRALFMERLEALESRFDKKFLFVERDHLYRRLFAENSATKMSYAAGAGLNELLKELDAVWENISSLAREPSIETADEVCRALLALFFLLGVEWQGDAEEGDISLRGTYIGLNLLSVSSGLRRVDYIVESLVHFCGKNLGQPRTKVEPFAMTELRDKSYSVVIDDGEAALHFKTHPDNRLHAFYGLYEHVRDAERGGRKVFGSVYSILRDIINGEHGCEYLTSPEKMKAILGRCSLVLSYQQMEAKEEGGDLDFKTVNEKILHVMRKMEDSLKG